MGLVLLPHRPVVVVKIKSSYIIYMTSQRGFMVTLNYWTDDDLANLAAVCALPHVDYYIFGFEGCKEEHHPHIHLSIHFNQPVKVTTFNNYWIKHHHSEKVYSYIHAHAYCKGYKDDNLKCKFCGENEYLTKGIIPEDGKNKTPIGVMASIKEGKTYDELKELFPGYMLHHGKKVKQWMLESKPKFVTSFYFIPKKMSDDAIGVVHDNFPDCKLAVIHELSDIEAYPEYDTVLYITELGIHPRQAEYWSRGVPIIYKYGYETKTINCRNFIIYGDTKPFFGYKKIY